VAGVASVISGVGTLLVVQFATAGAGISFVSPTLSGVLAAAAAFAVVSSVRVSS
jgi:hypothetical protein